MRVFNLSIGMEIEAKDEMEAKRLFWEWLDEQQGHDANSIVNVVDVDADDSKHSMANLKRWGGRA